MEALFELMAAPFAACVVLVGIHAYLGLHVIQRKVIFVDLALAQIAAFGATFGFLLGVSPHGKTAYLFSLGFALVGAAIFALTRMRHERIPQEAIIGIVYGVALASAILVADRAPEGSEHIKESLTGALLWVRWPTILKTAAIYSLVGLLHVALRRRFFQISFEPEQAYAEGRWVRLWDFIFYVTFAFVITSSVAIAGVLVVFSFLVIPAVIATLFAERISVRLTLGWGVGLAACAVGLVASYRLDFPSGPSVVASLGGALILAALVYSIWTADRRAHALLKVSAGIAVVAMILAGLGVFFTSGVYLQIAHEHDWESAEDSDHSAAEESTGLWEEIQLECSADPECLAHRLQEIPEWDTRLSQRLWQVEGDEREGWMEALGRIGTPLAQDLLAEMAIAESDPLLRLRGAELLLQCQDRRGLEIAIELLNEATPSLIRDESHRLVMDEAETDFGYDAFASAEENAVAVGRIRAWAAGLVNDVG